MSSFTICEKHKKIKNKNVFSCHFLILSRLNCEGSFVNIDQYLMRSVYKSLYAISRVECKTGVSQMVVFPQTLSPHHEGVMKITTFLSVNNENLGAIARMSNGT